jgi:hypothetical protein
MSITFLLFVTQNGKRQLAVTRSAEHGHGYGVNLLEFQAIGRIQTSADKNRGYSHVLLFHAVFSACIQIVGSLH